MPRTYLWVSSGLRNASQQTPALLTPLNPRPIILFALIGLLLAPLAVGHAYPPPDFKQQSATSDYSRLQPTTAASAKRLAISETPPKDTISLLAVATLHTGGWVSSLSFSPDGTLLAIGGEAWNEDTEEWEGILQLWDVASRQRIATLHAEGAVLSLSFSPDGTLLALQAGKWVEDDEIEGRGEWDVTLQLWDVASRQQVAILHEGGEVRSLSFSPDGTLLALQAGKWNEDTGEWEGILQLWDVASRQQVVTLHEGSWVSSLSFSPDGTLLAIGGEAWNEDTEEWEGTLQLWDVASRQQVVTLHAEGAVHSLSFSPDGTLLAIGRSAWNEDTEEWEGTLQLWDVANRQQVATFQVENWVSSLSFSPDGTLLALQAGKWNEDTEEWEDILQLWDVASRQQVATLHEGDEVSSLLFSPDGTLLAVWAAKWVEDDEGEGRGEWDGTLQLWDVASRQQVATLHEGGWVSSLSFSPDGTLLTAARAGQVPLWDVSEFKPPTEDDGESSGEPAGDSQEDPEPGPLASQTVTIDDVTSEAERGQMTFTVRLEPAPTAPTTVKYATASQTAKAGQDYEAATGTLRFGANQDTATFTVRIHPDEQAEPNETFAVRITHPSTRALLAEATGTITDDDGEAGEPQAWLTPDPAEVQFSADDPAWKTFIVHTNLDSVLVRANPSGSDPAIEVSGGQQAPTTDYCPAEGNDRPTSGRRDGWNLHVKTCQAGQTKILLIDYDTGEVLQQYEINVEASTSAAVTALNPSYPNPFNSETTLSYTLSTASDIRLEVFALNGQRVAVLHEGFQAAGYHTVAVDASALASGVYLYRLTTPAGRFVQKFTLLR